MGSGAAKGVAAAGDLRYQDAVEVCHFISEDVWPASGATCDLDDLVCFLCLSQNTKEVFGREEVPQPARPVTVAGDLGIVSARAEVPRQRLCAKQAELSSPAAAADSSAASGAASSG
eukprot:5062917-Pyramimonas_sp.AAC.1